MPPASRQEPRNGARSPGRRHASREQRRAQILAAAGECFARRGFHATTMDDLVEACGLSKGSLYWHFESKRDVFLALFDAFAQEFFDRWDTAARRRGNVVSLLRTELAFTLSAGSTMREMLPAFAEFLSDPECRERLAAIYRRAREVFEAFLLAGVERGEIRPQDCRGCAASLVALGEGMLLQAMVDPAFNPDAHLDALFALLERGVLRCEA